MARSFVWWYGTMVWRAWDFEADAGTLLNRYIARYGIRNS